MRYRLIFVLLSVVLWLGCYDEDPIVPTSEPEFKYTLPQGAHDYDQNIVEWFDRCGFYILYKFEPKDVYFNGTDWDEAVLNSNTNTYSGNITVVPAEEAYVGKQLALVEDLFFQFYADTMLQRCMPMKLLLCSSVKVWPVSTKQLNVYSGFDNLAVNWGCQEVEVFSKAAKTSFKNDVNTAFLERLLDRKMIGISEEFTKVSTYGGYVDEYSMYEQGFLKKGRVDAEYDWKEYIAAVVQYSYDYLRAEPDAYEDKPTMKGILHPNKDVHGLIREKYAILIAYFKNEYNIDLQAIGNK